RNCAVRFPRHPSTHMSARARQRTWTATAYRLTLISVKRVVRTYRHIETGRCSAGRVTHLGMAAAWNGNAADDGTSNLWLRSGGGLRVRFLFGRRTGRYHRECKHNGRNNGYDCFHRDPPSRLNKAMPANFARALLRLAAVLPTAPAIILAARPTSPVALEWEAEAVVVAIVVVPEVVVR